MVRLLPCHYGDGDVDIDSDTEEITVIGEHGTLIAWHTSHYEAEKSLGRIIRDLWQ